VRKTFRVAENLVLYCRPTRDKAQLANAPQWGIVANYLSRTRESLERAGRDNDAAAAAGPQVAGAGVAGEEVYDSPAGRGARQALPPARTERELVGDMIIPMTAEPAAAPSALEAVKEPDVDPIPQPLTITPAIAAAAAAAVATTPAPAWPTTADAGSSDVLDLLGPDATPESILGAVMRQNAGSFVECPVRAPMCVHARLAVGRDRSVVLFAVARQGLGDLRAIGLAYRWLTENRVLIGMAVPQFAIDTEQPPRLRLLVDQSDVTAEVLQPMLQSGHVTVQSYRRLRWGGRTGLLLEAA
jgi:hypothetical protein